MASSRDPKRARLSGLDAIVTSLDLASLGSVVCCMTVVPDGTRFVFTRSALFAITKGGMQSLVAGHKTERGFKDGQDSEARFNCPHGITVDGDGNLLVSDSGNHALRKVTHSGAVSTLAGNGQVGFADGIGAAVRFHQPMGIVVDTQGTVFVADDKNHCVRRVAPSDGAVTKLVGVGGEKGFADGQRAAARFNQPTGLALDVDDHLIVSDTVNHCIRKVTTAEGRVTTVAGRAGQHGFADGEGAAARFHHLQGITVDGNKNILVADTQNHRIWMIAGAKARVTTV
jgi:DNA-binding beta-propeller fold protein YncE